MGRRGKQGDYVSVVEACYQTEDDDQRWLQQLFQVAEPVLDRGGGIGLSLVHERPAGREIVLSRGCGSIEPMLRLSWPVVVGLDDRTYAALFYPRQPVVSAASLAPEFSEPARQAFAQLLAHARAQDLIGMLGYPARGWAFAMFIAVGDKPIDAALRATMRRLRIHVEASLRLRMFASSDAVAVIRPDGTLLHLADGELLSASARALSIQAKAIERARSRSGRADPHVGVAMWRALAAGRFSLVEKHDADGKRHYIAFENPPHVQLTRALTSTQAAVTECALRGLPDKETAYTLGLSTTRVSTAMRHAAERLGFASRQELVRMGARLLDKGVPARRGAGERRKALTPAELEVLRLVQRNLSNAEIAKRRKTSLHTVANQLAALFQKTGATSRRGLNLVRLPEEVAQSSRAAK